MPNLVKVDYEQTGTNKLSSEIELNMQNKTIVYNNGELELKVSVENESVWLNRNQLSELFDRDVKIIGKHINNIFKEKELEENLVVANFATTASVSIYK